MEIWVPTMIYHIEKKLLVCQQKVTWKWFLFRKYFQTEWLHCKVNERIAWIKDSNNSNFHRYASNASSWCVWLMMILHSSIIWWYFYFNLQMLGKCEKMWTHINVWLIDVCIRFSGKYFTLTSEQEQINEECVHGTQMPRLDSRKFRN